MKKPETDGSVRNEASSENVSGKLKKVKYGSMSLITIALVIALVVIFNAMASYMVKRSPLKIDLTADKRYELSDESIDFLKNDLDKDIDIVVTCQRSEFDSISDYVESLYLRYAGVSIDCPFDMIPILLDKYEMYANQGKGKISLRYVDLDKDPTAVKKYSDAYGEEIKAQSMVIACGDRVRVIDRDGIGGMISPDLSDQTKPKLIFAGESKITSEIMNVVDANPITVAFASKVNGQPIYSTSCEDSVTGLRDQLLTKNGYFCTDVDLLNDELDTEKFDMVVIPMPSVDFDKSVIEKLTNFLMNDGNYDKNLLFVNDYMASNIPNITEFLADWSIERNDGKVLVDGEKFMGSNPYMMQVVQASGEETGEKVNNSQFIVSPYSQELKILTKNNEAIVAPVLQTYDTSFSVDPSTQQTFDDKSVKNICLVSKKEKQIGHEIDTYKIASSKVMVLGSAYFTKPELLLQSNLYNNSAVLLNAINKMTGKETNTVIIPEKSLQQSTIAPTAKQDKTIKVIVIFIIPAIVAAIGLGVLLWRKNR
ncbi:GldG family protein [uncultured Ruminococcus sp.]|uniref:GldG family protein n=1 Tax=uncultured Ruminococcus sp. TaxID=165186 RepID=UPI00261BD946|nr:GldG family protein [uncultured Ruminococcus sp.]